VVFGATNQRVGVADIEEVISLPMPKRKRPIGFLAEELARARTKQLTQREIRLLKIVFSSLSDFERHLNKNIFKLFNDQVTSISKLLEGNDARLFHGLKLLSESIKAQKNLHEIEKKAHKKYLDEMFAKLGKRDL